MGGQLFLFPAIDSQSQIVIFGYSQVGIWIKELIPSRMIVFCDNAESRQGNHLNGEVVLSVSEAVERYPYAIFILASFRHNDEMKDQLLRKGIDENKIISELPAEIKECWNNEVNKAAKKRINARDSLRFEVNVVKHCNLNCRGCDHFAPLSKPDFMSISNYEKDMKRMSDLFRGIKTEIFILGGEPLLNPNIEKHIMIARTFFQDASIFIDTNGTLIGKMSDSFWEVCKDTKTVLKVTKYPINVNYDYCQRVAELHGVNIEYMDISPYDKEKTLWHFPLDLTGKQDARESFCNCVNANQCLTLENGRLYTCSIAPNIKAFNDYFKMPLFLTEHDGVDIYSAKTGKDILNRMAQPMPFCRYCDVKHRSYHHKWEKSMKDLKEWTL